MKTVFVVAASLMFAAGPALADPIPDPIMPVKKVESRELIESMSGKSVEGASAETDAILSRCSAMKFETTVEVGSGDAKRMTKVKLCSRAGETKAEWIVSLGEAAAKVQANDQLSPESRAQLVAAINAEIARLKS